MIIGAPRWPLTTTEDDRLFVQELGLVKRDPATGALRPANPIYQDVILRALSNHYEGGFFVEASLAASGKWVTSGRLDMTSLLKAFQMYWRENSGALENPYGYTEAVPHLVLNAFLQGFLDGRVELLQREYALWRRRLDLIAKHRGVSYPVELKLKSNQALKHQLAQLRDYMRTCGAGEGWLLVFDRDEKKGWDRKIYWKTETVDGATIHVVGC
jgi:hypothetical protein